MGILDVDRNVKDAFGGWLGFVGKTGTSVCGEWELKADGGGVVGKDWLIELGLEELL